MTPSALRTWSRRRGAYSDRISAEVISGCLKKNRSCSVTICFERPPPGTISGWGEWTRSSDVAVSRDRGGHPSRFQAEFRILTGILRSTSRTLGGQPVEGKRSLNEELQNVN